MGLEFIDISREEEYERPRVRSTVNGRRTERQNTGASERRRRPEGQRTSGSERRRRPEGQRTLEPVRRRRTEGHRASGPEQRGFEGYHISEPVRRRRPEEQRATVSEGRRSERQSTAVPHRKRRPEAEIYQISDNREARRRARAAELREEQVRSRRRKRRQKKMVAARMATLCFLVLLIAGSAFLLVKIVTEIRNTNQITDDFSTDIQPQEVIKIKEVEKPIITEDFIPINEFSRPGEVLPEVNNIFVHYTANPKTSAAQNRSYFENLGITGETSASAHFVIGYDGEIIQCVPLNEIAYAVIGRNYDSISIECCYLSADGRFTNDTYQSLIRLSAWLLSEYDLTPEDMRRHYDEGGKKCPLYFVEHENAWEQFIKDLKDYIMKEQV